MIAAGVVMVLIALLADVLGIGAEGFGWRRGAFLAVGIVVVLAGVAYLMAPARRDGTAPTPHRHGRRSQLTPQRPLSANVVGGSSTGAVSIEKHGLGDRRLRRAVAGAFRRIATL